MVPPQGAALGAVTSPGDKRVGTVWVQSLTCFPHSPSCPSWLGMAPLILPAQGCGATHRAASSLAQDGGVPRVPKRQPHKYPAPQVTSGAPCPRLRAVGHCKPPALPVAAGPCPHWAQCRIPGVAAPPGEVAPPPGSCPRGLRSAWGTARGGGRGGAAKVPPLPPGVCPPPPAPADLPGPGGLPECHLSAFFVFLVIGGGSKIGGLRPKPTDAGQLTRNPGLLRPT